MTQIDIDFLFFFMSTKRSCTSVHWRSVKKNKKKTKELAGGRASPTQSRRSPLSAGNQQERLAEEVTLVVESEEGSRGET